MTQELAAAAMERSGLLLKEKTVSTPVSDTIGAWERKLCKGVFRICDTGVCGNKCLSACPSEFVIAEWSRVGSAGTL